MGSVREGIRSLVTCFVQARLTSTRFPRKVLVELGGQRSIDRVLGAARAIKGVDDVFLITPDLFPEVAEDDVLGRYYAAWKRYGGDHIMRITGDCPLFDPQVGQLVLEKYFSRQVGYCSNVYPRRTFPDGLDCEVFSHEALWLAHFYAADPHSREHVTPWMQHHLAYSYVELPVNWSHVRLTLDTEEDLAWLRTVIQSPKSG